MLRLQKLFRTSKTFQNLMIRFLKLEKSIKFLQFKMAAYKKLSRLKSLDRVAGTPPPVPHIYTKSHTFPEIFKC